MTKERFTSLKFRAYMELSYTNERHLYGYTCLSVMLLSVDFENDTVKVIPFPDGKFEPNEFWVSIDYIELPKIKPKELKILK
jgi:hypothetical protein